MNAVVNLSTPVKACLLFILLVLLLLLAKVISINSSRPIVMPTSKPLSIPLDYVIPIPDIKATQPMYLFKGVTIFDDRGVDLALGEDFKQDNKNGFTLTPCLTQAYIDATTFTNSKGIPVACEGYIVVVVIDPVFMKPVDACSILYTGPIYNYYVLTVVPEASIKTLIDGVKEILKNPL